MRVFMLRLYIDASAKMVDTTLHTDQRLIVKPRVYTASHLSCCALLPCTPVAVVCVATPLGRRCFFVFGYRLVTGFADLFDTVPDLNSLATCSDRGPFSGEFHLDLWTLARSLRLRRYISFSVYVGTSSFLARGKACRTGCFIFFATCFSRAKSAGKTFRALSDSYLRGGDSLPPCPLSLWRGSISRKIASYLRMMMLKLRLQQLNGAHTTATSNFLNF